MLPEDWNDPQWDRRLAEADALLGPVCRVCPLDCDVDRRAGGVGRCKVGLLPVVGSAGLHFGEERCISGKGGTGAVFFSGCNLECRFCQSHAISVEVLPGAAARHAVGKPLVRGVGVTPDRLAAALVEFQTRGAATVSLISPTHVAPQAARAVVSARRAGLTVPVVWNCGGYESPAMVRLLAGVVDVWLPDVKTLDAAVGERTLGVPDYPRHVRAAVAGMVRQSGAMLRLDEAGVARAGVLVRHLVMPGGMSTSAAVIEWLAAEHPGIAINVMGQYRPAFRASGDPVLGSAVDPAEVAAVRELAERSGLRLVG